ncbi:MAG: 3-deoxy-7-phosphoheptulonate synthase class II [Actinomycetota bacterium]|nr:3-deoxy-7-phosphoheptulonate synthase class II [Actinomycetota bacterium]
MPSLIARDDGLMSAWIPTSWQEHPAAQQPDWPDPAALDTVLKELHGRPPLVFAGEARTLQAALARVARGEAFMLQAGDCAESFSDSSADGIRDKLKVILQMAVVLTYASGLPVVKVGRIAGQFAKPRSSFIEQRGDAVLPVFRGHAVNDAAFDAESRRADPRRLLSAYNQSASTLNLIRALTKGGFADLRQIHVWNQEFVAASKQGQRYEAIAHQIDRSLRFMAACGINLETDASLHEVDFYISHEALLLGYEEALTRQDSLTGDWYDCSAHLLWIGERTRRIDGAHVAFLSGVKNPIACKLSAAVTPDDVMRLCDALNPDNEPGRLTFIARMGADKVGDALPPLVDAVQADGRKVVWTCDPMHANTFVTSSGYKTRRLADIMIEIKRFFAVHNAAGTVPGGVHLELTHQNVTECLGGAEEIFDHDLAHRYEALCDPRLNARQSLDLAFEIGAMLQT